MLGLSWRHSPRCKVGGKCGSATDHERMLRRRSLTSRNMGRMWGILGLAHRSVGGRWRFDLSAAFGHPIPKSVLVEIGTHCHAMMDPSDIMRRVPGELRPVTSAQRRRCCADARGVPSALHPLRRGRGKPTIERRRILSEKSRWRRALHGYHAIDRRVLCGRPLPWAIFLS